MSFAGITFVLFCFVFVFLFSLKPWPFFIQSFVDMNAPRQPHAATAAYFCIFFVSYEMFFFEYYVLVLFIAFSFFCVLVERGTLYVDGVLPCDHGPDSNFDIS